MVYKNKRINRLVMLDYVRINAKKLVKKGYSKSNAFKKSWKDAKRLSNQIYVN